VSYKPRNGEVGACGAGVGAVHSVRRAAHVPCWWKSSQTALQAGSEAKGGGHPSPGLEGIEVKGELEQAMVYGDVTWAPSRKHSGCARAAYGRWSGLR